MEEPSLNNNEDPSIKPQNVDINKLFLPLAILLAGVMVSGTILYSNLSKAQLGGTGDETPGEVLTVENLKKWAKELKLNISEFHECVDNRTYQAEVQKDFSDGSALGVSGTPTFYINGEQIVGAQPFDVFKTAIDAAIGKPAKAAISIDDDAILGDPNAPVTIIEFSDFECPFCQRFFSETLSQIQKEYIDTGKARLVYRDFPLSFHPGAQPAAEAAECAKAQGKFWEMHDLIFSKQQ